MKRSKTPRIYRTIGISTILNAPKWNIIHAKLNLKGKYKCLFMKSQQHGKLGTSPYPQTRERYFHGTGMIASNESV